MNRIALSGVSMGLALAVGGCALLEPRGHGAAGPAAIAGACQRDARDALSQPSAGLGEEPRPIWTAPRVEEVWVPALVINGALIPGHREWVVIHPGSCLPACDHAQEAMPPAVGARSRETDTCTSGARAPSAETGAPRTGAPGR
jgi:hypothetical protein